MTILSKLYVIVWPKLRCLDEGNQKLLLFWCSSKARTKHILFFSRYIVQASFKISESNNWDVTDLAASEVRIIVLHCTQGEASFILEAAEKSGLTSHKYLWLVTQSVIGDPTDRSINRRALPLGMLGKWTKYFAWYLVAVTILCTVWNKYHLPFVSPWGINSKSNILTLRKICIISTVDEINPFWLVLILSHFV